MPSIECDNGKWKWGEYGECKYTTKEEAEKDNEDYYEDKASEETEKDMKKDEKRHVKEIIEDDKTITIVYEKDEKFEGIKVKESDTPDEGPTEDVDDEYDDEESHRFTSNIRIIMGSPCSGKNTFVERNKKDGDIIWDFDGVHTALSGSQSHVHHEHIRKYVFSLRDKFYEDVKKEKKSNVWIINSSPYKKVRDLFRSEMGAQIIYIERSKEDCLSTASNERPDEWEKYINNYFERFENFNDDEDVYIVSKKEINKRNQNNIWNKKTVMEKRYYNIQLEKRNVDGNSNPVIVGHAAVFGQLSENLGGFQERISPNAFDDVLENDCRCFFNHDPNHLLARTSSGTLRLSVDDKGLKYEFDVPDTTSGRDLLVSMDRGDITQSSFAFTVEDDSWDEENGIDIRTINKVKRLYDVSPVSIPAYPDANDLSVAKRGLAIYNEKQTRKDEEIDLIKRNLLELNIKILKKKR